MEFHFKYLLFLSVVAAAIFAEVVADSDDDETLRFQTETADTADGIDAPKEGSEEEYAKGSVCGYCAYCKFCKLCDEDCPCETSASKPNCKMCKYCKYCKLCSAVCDTVCQPGGILDRVSSTLINSLPSVDHSEVKSDIDSVQTWIDKKKDEL